uniref:Charged multivesicular body protein 4B n=1 Tax=Macaca nemestrina TaxID=9545 RepID=A0A2K6CA56_MACNE
MLKVSFKLGRAEAEERPAAAGSDGTGSELSWRGWRRLARRAATAGKAGKGGPIPQEAIQRLQDSEEMLSKKQEFLEKKIEQELTAAKKQGTKNKRAALQALKRKKRYEKRLAQIDGTLSTIEFQRQALENANTNNEVLKNVGCAAKAMKAAHDDMDIDKVDELTQDIADQQELAEEISTAIWKPVGFGEKFDEDELMEELDKNLLEISGPKTVPLPSVPSIALPSKPAKKKEGEDNDMKDLEKWAGSSAGWARFLVACAASWRVHVRGRQDGCGAGRFHRSRLSLQSSGTALLLTLCIA